LGERQQAQWLLVSSVLCGASAVVCVQVVGTEVVVGVRVCGRVAVRVVGRLEGGGRGMYGRWGVVGAWGWKGRGRLDGRTP